MKKHRKVFIVLLSLAMVFTTLPSTAFLAYAETGSGDQTVSEPEVQEPGDGNLDQDLKQTDEELTGAEESAQDPAATEDPNVNVEPDKPESTDPTVEEGGSDPSVNSETISTPEETGDSAEPADPADQTEPEDQTVPEDQTEPADQTETVDEPEDTGDVVVPEDNETTSEENADEKDDLSGAGFAKNGEVLAVELQGEATQSKEAAVNALIKEGLKKAEAEKIANTIFAKGDVREGEETSYPPSADGSYIEDTFRAEWITNDTVENGDPDLLYVKPGDNSVQSVKLRVSYALSGEHNYGPGDITITVPAKIFKTRWADEDAPANYGTMVLPYPQDPSVDKNYNWTYDSKNDVYILKNTRSLSAATSGFVEFMIAGLKPSDLVDMQESEPFSAYIQVLTHEGNTIARQSNEITAQFDTEARINKVTKRVYQSPEIVPASEIPEEQRSKYPDEEYFVKVDWYATVSVTSNTYFTLDFTDTFTDGDKYEGFVINANNAEGETSSYTKENAYHSYSIWSSDTFFVSTAYPLSQFEENTEHEFTNNIKFTCIQDDADPVHVDPDNEESDHRLRTTASSNAKTVWSYIDPGWPVPHGHFMIVKNGNDGKYNSNYTHYKAYGTRNYSDLHRWGKAPSDDGWYGIYPFALNEVQEDYLENQETGGDNGVHLSYTIDTIGYVMPWMFDPDTYDSEEGVKAPRNSMNYTRPVSITSLEKGLCFERNGERLEVGSDYDFVSLEFPEPSWIYKARPARIKANGSFNAVTWDDGTFIYTRDNDPAHQPDIDVEVQINGEWLHCATVSWKSGSFSADIERGSLGEGNIINLPEGTENFRTKVLLQNDPNEVEDNQAIQAAINYDVRVVVKLNPTDELVNAVDDAFDSTNNPQMYIYNNCELIPERAWLPEDDYDRIIGYHDENDEVITIKKDGYNVLRGYEIETQAFVKKEGSFNPAVDIKNGVATVHYSAQVEDRSYIKDKANYERAIADGRLKIVRHGYWRDLLPEGMTPDMSSISINNGSVVDAYYVQDYKGSGRTLLVVEVQRSENPRFVNPQGTDMGYYSDFISISFKATMDAQSILDYAEETEDASHNKKWKVHNVISFESSNEFLGSVPGYVGEPDDPSVNNHYNSSKAFDNAKEKGYMTNLNGRDDPSFVYAGVYTILDIPQGVVNGYAKEVQVNNDGIWSTGLYYGHKDENARIVYTGGLYSYRLSFVPETDEGIAKDIRIMDSLENYQPVQGNDDIDVDKPEDGYIVPHWKGTFLGVDVRQLVSQGCDPVVYYSTIENLDLEEGLNINEHQYGNMDLNDSSVWVKAENYNGQLSAVKAVAIDASKKKDGSDFELEAGDSISVIINMLAPSLEEANELVEQQGDWGDSAQAYNNAAMLYKNTSTPTSQEDDFKKIHNDYTKVGLEPFEIDVEKIWSDDNNRDGIRPESITVELIAKIGDEEKTIDTVQLPKVDDEGNQSWKHTFTGIPYVDPNGNQIRYSVKENPIPDGYTVSISKKDYSYRITNKHVPEKTSVSGSKIWEGDTEGTRPDSIKVRLYKNGKYYGSKTVKADPNGEWSYIFDNLYKYEKGEEIVWTVQEDVSTVPATYISTQDGNNFVNVYHPYGDLTIEKIVKDATALSKDKEFEFKIRFFTYDEDGEEVNDFGIYNYDLLEDGQKIGEGTVTSGDTLRFKGGQKIHIKEIEAETNYVITENSTEGFILATSSGSEGTIRPNNTVNAVFTNKYSATGHAELDAFKTLRGQNLKRYNFHYEIYEVQADGSEKLIRTAANEAGTPSTDPDGTVVSTGSVPLGGISYTEKDSYTGNTPYKDFRYVIKETIPTGAEKLDDGRFYLDGYVYDTTIYYANVRVSDNGDGTLTTVVKYLDEDENEIDPSKVMFNNEYHAYGSIALRAWKQLIGRDLRDGEFQFKLQDENGNDILDERGNPIIVSNDKDGIITFPEIEYDEKDDGKTFKYRIVEIKGDDETVQYDERVFGYIVTVKDIGKGRMQATAQKADPNNNWSIDNAPLALFENPLYPGGLKITKKIVDTTGEADPDQTFTIKVEFADTDMETIDVDTDVYTGEYTWDKDTQTATFTLRGDESVVINDLPAGVFYRVYELNEAGWALTGRSNVQSSIEPLVIKEAELTNTYTPNDAYFIFNGIKYLDGKAAPATYTDKNGNRYNFSFTLSWYDPSYDRWWTLQSYVNSSDGGFIQFNPIRYKSRTWYENWTPGGEIQFRVVENISSAEGIEFDTQTEYIYVKVTQVDGKYKVTYRYPDDGDPGIVFNNKTKPGELRVTKNGGDLSNYSETTQNDEFAIEVTFRNEEGKPLGENDEVYYYILDKDGNIVQNDQNGNKRGFWTKAKEWASDTWEDIKEVFTEPIVDTAYGAEEEIIYSGTFDGVDWRINSDGELVLGKEGEEQWFNGREYNTDSNYYMPTWCDYGGQYSRSIKSVRFEGTVHGQKRMAALFYQLNLDRIDLTNLDTSEATGMVGLFWRCKVKEPVDFSKLDTSNVDTMYTMFSEAEMPIIDLRTFDTRSLTTMERMFYGTNTPTILIGAWSNPKLVRMPYSFYGCEAERIDLTGFTAPICPRFTVAFANCTNLKELDLSSLVIGMSNPGSSYSVTYESMFSGCTSLERLDISNFSTLSTGGSAFVNNMFGTAGNSLGRMPSLRYINLGPNFRFWYYGQGEHSNGVGINILPTPPDPYDGWMRVDGSSFDGKTVFTPLELRKEYNSNYNAMAGWWTWHLPDTQGVIRFDANGGYIEPDAEMYVVDFMEEDATVKTPTEPIVRMPGFEIASWNTEPDGSGTSYPAGAEGLEGVVEAGEEITLYAQWTKSDKVRYTVKYYLQNNESVWSPTYELADMITVTESQPGEYEAPLREYDGYVTPSQQTAVVEEDYGTIIEYRYKRVHYTLSFDGNEATDGSMRNIDMFANVPVALPANEFTKEHAVFTGWNTEPDGSGDYYSDMQTVSNLTANDGETVTLYAQWFVIEDTLTPATGGTVTVTVQAGQTIVFPELPAGTTYTIREINVPDGWEYMGTVDSGNGVIKVDNTSSASVNNFYSAKVEVPLEALKVLEGKDLEEGEFTFELWTEANWNRYVEGQSGGGMVKPPRPLQTKTNGDVSTDDEGQASVIFDKLTFMTGKEDVIGKTFTYVIRELKEDEDGITYDEHIQYVDVTITDAGHGLLEAEVEYWHYDPDTGDRVVDKDGAVFNNKYTPPPGSLKITKAIVGDVGKERLETEFEFTLEIKGPDGEDLTGKYSGLIVKDGVEDKFTYEPGKTITLGDGDYVIINGLPDGSTYTVTEKDQAGWEIASSENVEGTIESYVTSEALFNNTYDAKGYLTLKATKNVIGRDLKDKEFKFALFDEYGGLIEEATNDEEGNVVFTTLEFGLKDVDETYVYTVSEVAGEDKNITYDTKEYQVTVTITDNGDGTLNVETSENADSLIFNNPYHATGNVTFRGFKTVEGREMNENDIFTFQIKEEGTNRTWTARNDALGVIGYPTIEYNYNPSNDIDDTGLHTYTVTETSTDGNGITVDRNTYTVTVNVTSDGSGKLVVEPSDNYRTLNFINTYEEPYKAEGEITFEGTKTLEGREMKEGDVFTFSIEEEGTDNTWTATNNAEGEIGYPTIEYVYDPVTGRDDRGDHTYKVTETTQDGNGITVDTNTYTVNITVTDDGKGNLEAAEAEESDNHTALDFVNTYSAEGDVTFEGKKIITGREMTSEDIFVFRIEEKETGNIWNFMNDAEGKIEYPTLNFTLDDLGEHTYTVREMSEDANGVVVDKNVYEVTVNVTDNGDGTLNVESEDDYRALNFINTYTAENEITFTGSKSIDTRSLEEGEEFDFTLYDGEGNEIETVQNDGSAFQFSPLGFTVDNAGKEYIYTVKETSEPGNGVSIDGTVYHITVTVTDNGDGTLTIESETEEGVDTNHLAFVNPYDAAGEITFEGTKKIDGRDLTKDDVFEFRVTEAGTDNTWTVTNDETGKIGYPTIEYSLEDAGEHVYTVEETSGDGNDITADTTVYTVKVRVEDNKDGTLKVEATDNYKGLNFVNTYEPPEKPKTGDTTDVMPYAFMVTASLLLLMVLFRRRKSNKA